MAPQHAGETIRPGLGEGAELGRRRQRDLISQGFEPFDGLPADLVLVAPVEVVHPQVRVGLLTGQDVPDIHHEAVGDDHRRTFGAFRARPTNPVARGARPGCPPDGGTRPQCLGLRPSVTAAPQG